MNPTAIPAEVAVVLEAQRHRIDAATALVERLAGDVERVAAAVAEHLARPAATAVPSWLALPADPDTARRVLGELADWLGAVYLRYPDGAAGLPDCWLWHPDVVEELLWLMHAWQAAYRGVGGSVCAVGDWHDRYRPGVVARISAVAGTCSPENHQSRTVRPAGPPPTPTATCLDPIAAWWAQHRDQAPPEPTEQSVSRAAQRPDGGSSHE